MPIEEISDRNYAIYWQKSKAVQDEYAMIHLTTERENMVKKLEKVIGDVKDERKILDDLVIAKTFTLMLQIRAISIQLIKTIKIWQETFTRQTVRPQLMECDYIVEKMLKHMTFLNSMTMRRVFKFQFLRGNILLLPLATPVKTPVYVPREVEKLAIEFASPKEEEIIDVYQFLINCLPQDIYEKNLLPMEKYLCEPWTPKLYVVENIGLLNNRVVLIRNKIPSKSGQVQVIPVKDKNFDIAKDQKVRTKKKRQNALIHMTSPVLHGKIVDDDMKQINIDDVTGTDSLEGETQSYEQSHVDFVVEDSLDKAVSEVDSKGGKQKDVSDAEEENQEEPLLTEEENLELLQFDNYAKSLEAELGCTFKDNVEDSKRNKKSYNLFYTAGDIKNHNLVVDILKADNPDDVLKQGDRDLIPIEKEKEVDNVLQDSEDDEDVEEDDDFNYLGEDNQLAQMSSITREPTFELESPVKTKLRGNRTKSVPTTKGTKGTKGGNSGKDEEKVQSSLVLNDDDDSEEGSSIPFAGRRKKKDTRSLGEKLKYSTVLIRETYRQQQNARRNQEQSYSFS